MPPLAVCLLILQTLLPVPQGGGNTPPSPSLSLPAHTDGGMESASAVLWGTMLLDVPPDPGPLSPKSWSRARGSAGTTPLKGQSDPSTGKETEAQRHSVSLGAPHPKEAQPGSQPRSPWVTMQEGPAQEWDAASGSPCLLPSPHWVFLSFSSLFSPSSLPSLTCLPSCTFPGGSPQAVASAALTPRTRCPLHVAPGGPFLHLQPGVPRTP